MVKNESELKGAFEVRKLVFVEEQGIAEELDFDGNDCNVIYMVVKSGAHVIGTARVRYLNA